MKKEWTIDELNEAFEKGSPLEFTDKEINEETRRYNISQAHKGKIVPEHLIKALRCRGTEEEVVAKRIAGIRKSRESPEFVEKMRNTLKQVYSTPEGRKRQSDKAKAFAATEKGKAHYKDMAIKSNLDLSVKEKKSKALTKRLHDEWADPTKRSIRLERVKEALADPAVRAKMSAASLGKPKPRATCPHCGKEGGINGIKRYHFDNCKLKP